MSEFISKSQKKREADALQKLGLLLTQLDEQQLSTFPISDTLFQAILAAKAIKSHGAKKRQAQLIGKLMRSEDGVAIQTAYDHLLSDHRAQTTSFHEAEQWRERLISEGNVALTEFIATYHPENVQQLRQLIKKAKADKLEQKNSGAATALFRVIKQKIS